MIVAAASKTRSILRYVPGTGSVPVEVAGYIARCFPMQSPTSKNLYSVQFSLVVLAPILMAVACYVVFVGVRTQVDLNPC